MTDLSHLGNRILSMSVRDNLAWLTEVAPLPGPASLMTLEGEMRILSVPVWLSVSLVAAPLSRLASMRVPAAKTYSWNGQLCCPLCAVIHTP